MAQDQLTTCKQLYQGKAHGHRHAFDRGMLTNSALFTASFALIPAAPVVAPLMFTVVAVTGFSLYDQYIDAYRVYAAINYAVSNDEKDKGEFGWFAYVVEKALGRANFDFDALYNSIEMPSSDPEKFIVLSADAATGLHVAGEYLQKTNEGESKRKMVGPDRSKLSGHFAQKVKEAIVELDGSLALCPEKDGERLVAIPKDVARMVAYKIAVDHGEMKAAENIAKDLRLI